MEQQPTSLSSLETRYQHFCAQVPALREVTARKAWGGGKAHE